MNFINTRSLTFFFKNMELYTITKLNRYEMNKSKTKKEGIASICVLISSISGSCKNSYTSEIIKRDIPMK